MLSYYVIDTETNGLKNSYHECIEIGIVRYTDRVQLWRQIKCEYPERSNYDSLKVTNKTLADLALGYPKERVVEECNQFFEEDGLTPAHRCIVCHNVAFDRKFLHAMWAACNQVFPAQLWICSMALTKEYAKEQGLIKKGSPKPKFNLHAACDLVGIKKFTAKHDAKTDSRNTYLLFRSLLEDKQVNHLPLIKTVPHFSSAEETDLEDQ